MSGALAAVKKATLDITGINYAKKKGAFKMFEGPEGPGTPEKQEDPQVALAREATNSAIAGDIAVRNARQRSSTLGTGARFLQNETARTATSTLSQTNQPGNPAMTPKKPKKAKKKLTEP